MDPVYGSLWIDYANTVDIPITLGVQRVPTEYPEEDIMNTMSVQVGRSWPHGVYTT